MAPEPPGTPERILHDLVRLLDAFHLHGWEIPEPSEQMEGVLAWIRREQLMEGWDPWAPWPDPN